MNDPMRKTGRFCLLVLALLLLIIPCTPLGRRLSSAVLSPFIGAAQRGSQALTTTWHTFAPWGETTDARIRHLQEEISELRVRLSATAELERQNRDLRAALQLSPPAGWRAVTVAVIARDPALWDFGFTVDKGSAEGLRPGAAVLSGPHLIGRIASVTRHASRVVCLPSPECRVSLRLAGSDSYGISSGQSTASTLKQPLFTIDFLPKGIQPEAGRLLCTSGLSEWMPGEIPVARIEAPEGAPPWELIEQSRTRLTATPLAEMRALRLVTVLCTQPAPR